MGHHAKKGVKQHYLQLGILVFALLSGGGIYALDLRHHLLELSTRQPTTERTDSLTSLQCTRYRHRWVASAVKLETPPRDEMAAGAVPAKLRKGEFHVSSGRW